MPKRAPRTTPPSRAKATADKYITPKGKKPSRKTPQEEPGEAMLTPFLLDPASAIVPDKPKMGRPTKMTEAIVDAIIGHLIEGQSILDISEMDGMPSRRTIMNWQAEDETFRTRIAMAREEQADLMDDLVYRTARLSTALTAPADRVKLTAYTWRASHLKPRKYGQQQNINLIGTIENRNTDMLRHLQPSEREVLRALVEAAQQRQQAAEEQAVQSTKMIEGKARRVA